MRARSLGLGLAVLLVAGAGKLQEFVSEEGRFAVALPGTPEVSEVPIRGEGGPQRQFMLNRGEGAYLVSYQDNPGLVRTDVATLHRKLKATQDDLATTLPGKLLREARIELDGKYPGREFVLEVRDGTGNYRARMYLVRGRLYQVIAVGVPRFANAPEADRVLESFRLTK